MWEGCQKKKTILSSKPGKTFIALNYQAVIPNLITSRLSTAVMSSATRLIGIECPKSVFKQILKLFKNYLLLIVGQSF